MDDVTRGGRPKRVRNEAVFLYDMNVDDVFQTLGYIVLDSSLGLIDPGIGSVRINDRGAPSSTKPPVH